jgi:pyrrolysine biosynthesis protein PylD
MTRLTKADVINISAELGSYDKELQKKTGRTLLGIACQAAGVDELEVGTAMRSITACVVPMDCGQGIIEGFCDAVKQIVQHLGCRAFITSHSDASGIAEAFEKKCDIIFLADDYRFVAITRSGSCVVDNSLSTAKGFVAGLSLMMGGLDDRRILLIGCGQVGRHAAFLLVSEGAQVAACDIKHHRVLELTAEVEKLKGVRIRAEDGLDSITTRYDGLLDATPAAEIIQPKHVHIQSCVSAPGVPHGLCSGTLEMIGGRFLHDPLQIGVATMLVEAVKGL